MGMAEQGTEGEDGLGKTEAVEAQANTSLRKRGNSVAIPQESFLHRKPGASVGTP